MPQKTTAEKIRVTRTPKQEDYSQHRFLENTLNNLITQRNSYDLRTEMLLAISGGVFLFSLQSIVNPELKGTLGFLLIAGCALFACILCIFSLKPPDIFINRADLPPSIIHHRTIFEFEKQDFQKEMDLILKDRNKIKDEYLKMIYNLSIFQTIRKKYFINQAGHVLVIGLVVGFLLIFFLP